MKKTLLALCILLVGSFLYLLINQQNSGWWEIFTTESLRGYTKRVSFDTSSFQNRLFFKKAITSTSELKKRNDAKEKFEQDASHSSTKSSESTESTTRTSEGTKSSEGPLLWKKLRRLGHIQWNVKHKSNIVDRENPKKILYTREIWILHATVTLKDKVWNVIKSTKSTWNGFFNLNVEHEGVYQIEVDYSTAQRVDNSWWWYSKYVPDRRVRSKSIKQHRFSSKAWRFKMSELNWNKSYSAWPKRIKNIVFTAEWHGAKHSSNKFLIDFVK